MSNSQQRLADGLSRLATDIQAVLGDLRDGVGSSPEQAETDEVRFCTPKILPPELQLRAASTALAVFSFP